jgi:hypothetical protein
MAFTPAEFNVHFSGDQACENCANIQRFDVCLCLHHNGLMQVEKVSETCKHDISKLGLDVKFSLVLN